MSHTKTPWHVGYIGEDEFRREVIFDENHGQVAEVLEKANAAFICRAANCHDQLVEAASYAIGKLNALIRRGVTEEGIAEESLRAALANAEGGAA